MLQSVNRLGLALLVLLAPAEPAFAESERCERMRLHAERLAPALEAWEDGAAAARARAQAALREVDNGRTSVLIAGLRKRAEEGGDLVATARDAAETMIARCGASRVTLDLKSAALALDMEGRRLLSVTERLEISLGQAQVGAR